MFLQRYKCPKTQYQSLRQMMASTVWQERQLVEWHKTVFASLNTCSEFVLVASIARYHVAIRDKTGEASAWLFQSLRVLVSKSSFIFARYWFSLLVIELLLWAEWPPKISSSRWDYFFGRVVRLGVLDSIPRAESNLWLSSIKMSLITEGVIM